MLAAMVGVCTAAAAFVAWLHAASMYLHAAAAETRGLPLLWPIYYRILLSLLTKPREISSQNSKLPLKRITTGRLLPCRCAQHAAFMPLCLLCDSHAIGLAGPVSSQTKLLQLCKLCGTDPGQVWPPPDQSRDQVCTQCVGFMRQDRLGTQQTLDMCMLPNFLNMYTYLLINGAGHAAAVPGGAVLPVVHDGDGEPAIPGVCPGRRAVWLPRRAAAGCFRFRAAVFQVRLS